MREAFNIEVHWGVDGRHVSALDLALLLGQLPSHLCHSWERHALAASEGNRKRPPDVGISLNWGVLFVGFLITRTRLFKKDLYWGSSLLETPMYLLKALFSFRFYLGCLKE